MAEQTKIQWCHHTFNPWIGCAKVSEGCQNCYAENLMANRYGRVVWGENGTRSRTKTWGDPLKWNRQALAAGEPHKVFCASLADVFEDRDELIPWRQDLFRLIDKCQNLYWLLLTKRPEEIVSMWPDQEDGFTAHRGNCWLGTSIANQKNADECIDRLITAKHLAPALFLSCEPQIAFVDLSPWLKPKPLVDWVIVGGESKQSKDPRAFHVEWATDMVDQCKDAGVPVFVKQLGSNVFKGKKQIHLKDGHGGDMAEWPAHLRVRECPETFAYA